MLLDVTNYGQTAHSSRKREAEAPTVIHRNQVIRRRQGHVSTSEMQHHRRYLHLREPGQIETRVEERELRRALQMRGPDAERVPEGNVGRSGEAGH